MKCCVCGSEFGQLAGYKLIRLNVEWDFCGRLCLTDWVAPELKKAVVFRQWIPTAEEEERMRQ